MTALPQIAEHGYELCAVSQFMERASAEHIARMRRDMPTGFFIIWDPNDDEDGFMIRSNSVAKLNREFMSFFAGVIE